MIMLKSINYCIAFAVICTYSCSSYRIHRTSRIYFSATSLGPCNIHTALSESRNGIQDDSSSPFIESSATSEKASNIKKYAEFPSSALPASNYAKETGTFMEKPTIFDVILIPLEPSFTRIMDSAKSTRLLNYRSYAKRDAFDIDKLYAQPSLEDLSPPPRTQLETLWISPLYRWAILVVSYVTFPSITQLLERFVTMSPTELAEITNQFLPGVSILYGTFVSITLSILYERQNKIQTNISTESSILTLVLRNILSLFRSDEKRIIPASQCVADQIRHLVKESRGQELMCLIYSDPYSKMLELIMDKERECRKYDSQFDSAAFSSSKDSVKELIKLRAQRLSDEALALPPTHFFVLSTLTILILMGYTVSVLPTISSTGKPSIESSILFSVLCTVYTLFYNFANDLNNPFQGVYQIRRSSTAAHLLQIKWLLVNHPDLKGKIDFFTNSSQRRGEDGEVIVWTPGLGEINLNRIDGLQELRDH